MVQLPFYRHSAMASTKGAGAGGRTRNGAPSSEEWQVWQSVCSYLRTLDSARGASVADYGRLSGVSDQNVKQADSLVDSLVKSISEEQHAIDGALERISILTSLRQATEGSAASARRKRKVEDTSPSPSADDVEVLGEVKRRASDARKARNSISTGNTKRGAGEVQPHRSWLTAQLPLRPGRKVAFCEPRATAAAAAPGAAAMPEEGEVWILATVTGSIGNDKLRYVVQDAEEEGTNGPYVYPLLCFALTHRLQHLEHDTRLDRTASNQPRFSPTGGLYARLTRACTIPGHELLLLCYSKGRRTAPRSWHRPLQGAPAHARPSIANSPAFKTRGGAPPCPLQPHVR